MYTLEEENMELAKLAGINIPIENNITNTIIHLDTSNNIPMKEMNSNNIDIDDAIDNQIHNEEDCNNDNVNDNSNIDEIEHDLSILQLNNITNDTSIIVDSTYNNTTTATIEEKEEEYIVQSGFGSKYIEEKKKIYTKYLKSNEILRIIIDLVNSSGIVTEEHHLNEYYYHGNLIDE